MTDTMTVTPKQAGTISGLGLAAINAAIETGALPYISKPPGDRYRLILRDDLAEYLRSLRKSA